MPLPKPEEGEILEEFISRCMANEQAMAEFPDDKQRAAACSVIYADATAKSYGDLTAPIAWKDDAKRIVYGPVLVPDIPDSDGDTVTAEKIERVAHKFMEEYRLMEHMHTLRSVAHPVESYLAPTDLSFGDVQVPKGSWIVGAKVTDDETWEDVVSNKLGGFSIVAVPAGATKSEKAATKKVTLRDIEAAGQDWEVIAIGLVDRPAVPLAKWTAVKREEEPSAWDKVKLLLFSKQQEEEEESSTKGDNVTPEQIKELVESESFKETLTSAFSEASKPLAERLDALEKSSSKEASEEEEKAATITEEDVEKAATAAAAKVLADVLTKFDEHIESRKTPSFKAVAESLRGQDGHTSEKSGVTETRDIFGRLVKS